MSGKTAKRKEVEQSSSDEIEPGRQKKYRRTGYVKSVAAQIPEIFHKLRHMILYR